MHMAAASCSKCSGFREDHPLTRGLLVRLKCFVHVGDGQWFICSSGPTCIANGGVVGVWNVNGYGALLDYPPRMGRSVLEVPAIKQYMVENGEKKLWDKCMKYTTDNPRLEKAAQMMVL